MKHVRLTPENTELVILSFEGPDGYSNAGGLGVRITNLAVTLANLGFITHLFFVGDPRRPGVETRCRGQLVLHRWCQWISEYYPNGVYEGENEKLYDFNESIPWFVRERILNPVLEAGKTAVILGEEWHTAEAMCRIGAALTDAGARDRALMFWNANNTFSFHRIDWERLKRCTTITTVSRYMKHLMWALGLNPLVVPNGIPRALLRPVREKEARQVRTNLGADVLLTKVARWDPAKGWDGAIDAVSRLRAAGARTTLITRGGFESYGHEVMQRAASLGLTVAHLHPTNGSADYFAALSQAGSADIVNLMFPAPLEFLRVLYRASDAVLANSGHEPFGLVGLEAMAAGGLVFTGSTGEEYAIPFVNSFVLDTGDPREIESYLIYLRDFPEEGQRMRKAARATARQFTWEATASNLISKLENQGRFQGVLSGKIEPEKEFFDPTRVAA
jgi:glycosyltransferase involved in cell wall biosynthesis